MTILTHTQNHFDIRNFTLTRLYHNKQYTIYIPKSKDMTVKELNRLCNLDDESFKLLSNIQRTSPNTSYKE